jgi:5'-nucleotidase
MESLFESNKNRKILGRKTSKELIIGHINDSHSAVRNTPDGSLGFPLIKGIVDDFRKRKDFILLDAGDTFHGEAFASLSKGESIVKILNVMKFDAMAPGNHDFGYGVDRLMELKNKVNFPMIAANIVNEKGNRPFKSYTIIKKQGIKIGVFGLATPETATKERLSDVKGLEFLPPKDVAEDMVKTLKEKKVDIIIALAHLGLNGDYTSLKLADEVRGIDIIVDGHSHSELKNGVLLKDTLIAQTGEKTKNFGVIRIGLKNKRITEKKAYLISKSQASRFKEDAKVLEIIEKTEKKHDKYLSSIVGFLDKKLDGERQNCRTREMPLGRLVAEAMRSESGSDAAILGGGGMRSSIEKGSVTMGDILKVLPFGNTLVIKELTGTQLLQALENGVSSYPEQNGAFPQTSGLEVEFDPSKERGKRILEAKINGKDISTDQNYKVAFARNVADGSDGYTMIKDAPEISQMDLLENVLVRHIKKHGFKYASNKNGIKRKKH